MLNLADELFRCPLDGFRGNHDFCRDGRWGWRGRRLLCGGFQSVNFLLLPFYRLAQFCYLHVIREVVGGEGIRQTLRKLLDVSVVFRMRASGGTKHVDSVDVVGVMVEHNNLLLGVIPFSNIIVIESDACVGQFF